MVWTQNTYKCYRLTSHNGLHDVMANEWNYVSASQPAKISRVLIVCPNGIASKQLNISRKLSKYIRRALKNSLYTFMLFCHFSTQSLQQKRTWPSVVPKPGFHCRRILDHLGPPASHLHILVVSKFPSMNSFSFGNKQKLWGPGLANTLGDGALSQKSAFQMVRVFT